MAVQVHCLRAWHDVRKPGCPEFVTWTLQVRDSDAKRYVGVMAQVASGLQLRGSAVKETKELRSKVFDFLATKRPGEVSDPGPSWKPLLMKYVSARSLTIPPFAARRGIDKSTPPAGNCIPYRR